MTAMQLGLLTACLPHKPLADIATWAAGRGFEALEVAAWPLADEKPYAVTHVDVDALVQQGPAQVSAIFEQHGLTLSSLAYYDNVLHPDPSRRERIRSHLRRCVDAAALLGCPTVGTFIGRDPGRSVADNLAEAEVFFPALVHYARERAVRIVIENCVMNGWHPDGYPGNLAYSPELWAWLGSLGLFLNFDPSHLPPIGIDPVAVLPRCLDLVAHVQAKDVEVSIADRYRYSFYGPARSPEGGWWRYRVPGLGQVDWRGLLDVLAQGGFDGVVSVEHEDLVHSGSEEQVEAGLEIAYRTLRPLL